MYLLLKSKLTFFSNLSQPYLKITIEIFPLHTTITGLILRGIP